MGAKKQAAKAGAAAVAVKNSPYVKAIMQDKELRQNLWSSYESAHAAVSRLQNGKKPAQQIFDDKKLQKDIKAAAESFRDASVALREAPNKKKRGGGLGKLVLLVVVGGAVALVVSEGLRKKVLDALFGAEEEFEYTSTTSPPSTSTPSSSSATADTTTT